MIRNPSLNRLLWAVTAFLALVVSVIGVWNPGIYAAVVSPSLIPGAFSQDLMSLAAAVVLLYLALTGGDGRPRRQLAALGLLGYFFYAYGIYVIERAYNGLYLLYMAIFALSFWALLYGGSGLRCAGGAALPKVLRLVSASGALLQPLIFYPLWIAMLLPLMASGDQIDSLYSIFILDLCFIMPAFLILSVLTYRSRDIGLLLLPALYILGFTLIFSLALGELVKPLFNDPVNLPSFAVSLVLSLFFLVVGFLHLTRLRLQPSRPST